jgi:tape measure domain-containing protein
MAGISAVLQGFTEGSGGFDSFFDVADKLSLVSDVAGTVVEQLKNGVEAVESYVKVNAKLGLMTDSLQEQDELQKKIVRSANNARTSYEGMAQTVTGLSAAADGLFGSNNEMVAFAESMQKAMIASGTDSEMQPEVTQRMSAAVVSGGMDSSDLMFIAQSAPVMYQAIADYTGKSREELISMAGSGELTAETIKNSMLGMSSQIDASFSEMPLTFSDIMQNVENAGTDAFGNLFLLINDLLTSDKVIDFFNGITDVIYFVGDAINYVIGLVTENWPVIESILMAIGILIAQKIAAEVINLMPQLIGFLATTITKLAASIPLLLQRLAIIWMTNAPLVILIATIAAGIYLLRTMGEETFGFIFGLFGVIFALFTNVFLALTQFLIGIIEHWVNPLINFANFFANLFVDPIGAIIHLFGDLADGVLNVLEKIASGIDFVFGSNLADTVSGWRAGLKDYTDKKAAELGNGKYEEKIAELDINSILGDLGISMERSNYGDSWEAFSKEGEKFGKGVEDMLGGGDNNNQPNTTDSTINTKDFNLSLDNILPDTMINNGDFNISPETDLGLAPELNYTYEIPGQDTAGGNIYNSGYSGVSANNYNAVNNNLANDPLLVKGSGTGGAVEVEMPDEDLDYLREIAERDYIANIASNSLAPNISVQFGDVHETADADKVAGRIKQILQEEIAMVSEGVY